MSAFRLIPLSDASAWVDAVRGLDHAPAHTHSYNLALSHSLESDIVLLEYRDNISRAVCPLLIRPYEGVFDVATPYGFSGVAMQGDCKGFVSGIDAFAREQKWVCGYFGLHPFLPSPFAKKDIEEGKPVFELDLTQSEEKLFSSLHRTHRYEIRRDEKLLGQVNSDTNDLTAQLPRLYAETLARVGASSVYHFSEQSLADWLSSENCFALGLGKRARSDAIIVVQHTGERAEYFLNASNDEGRSFTRLLLWAAILELKNRNVKFFNLGGGASEGDELEAFKRRFGGTESRVRAIKRVFDASLFQKLCKAKSLSPESAHYFPPYRAA